MSEKVSYRWEPISGLPEGSASLANSELRSLAQVWIEQKDGLSASEALEVFNDRLRRQWAVETGIIERVYTLDRGVTQLLIEKGIDRSMVKGS